MMRFFLIVIVRCMGNFYQWNRWYPEETGYESCVWIGFDMVGRSMNYVGVYWYYEPFPVTPNHCVCVAKKITVSPKLSKFSFSKCQNSFFKCQKKIPFQIVWKNVIIHANLPQLITHQYIISAMTQIETVMKIQYLIFACFCFELQFDGFEFKAPYSYCGSLEFSTPNSETLKRANIFSITRCNIHHLNH
jgi:hypothetical protein